MSIIFNKFLRKLADTQLCCALNRNFKFANMCQFFRAEQLTTPRIFFGGPLLFSDVFTKSGLNPAFTVAYTQTGHSAAQSARRPPSVGGLEWWVEHKSLVIDSKPCNTFENVQKGHRARRTPPPGPRYHLLIPPKLVGPDGGTAGRPPVDL